VLPGVLRVAYDSAVFASIQLTRRALASRDCSRTPIVNEPVPGVAQDSDVVLECEPGVGKTDADPFVADLPDTPAIRLCWARPGRVERVHFRCAGCHASLASLAGPAGGERASLGGTGNLLR
jgi:hypothetical protein